MLDFLYIANFFTLFLSTFKFFSIGNFSVPFNTAIVVIFFFLIIKKIIWEGKKINIPINEVVIGLLGLLLIISITSISPILSGKNEYILQFFKTYSHIFYVMVFALFNLFFKVDEKKWVFALKTFLICMLIINIFGIYQLFARIYDLPFAWIEITNVSANLREKNFQDTGKQIALNFDNYFRATSIFSEPTILAQNNLFSLIFLLTPYFNGGKPFVNSKLFTFVFLIFSLFSLFLAFSLTGFFGLALLIAAVFVFQKNVRISVPTLIFSIIIGILAIIIADQIVYTYTHVSVLDLFKMRLGSIAGAKANSLDVINGESYFDRANEFKQAIRAWKENPYLGLGMGLTYTAKLTEMPFLVYTSLTFLVETGFIGLLAYSTFMLLLLYKAFNLKNKYYKIDPKSNLTSFATITFYVMIFEIYVNYFTAGWFINEYFWHHIALLFWLMSYEARVNDYKTIRLKFINTPLNKIFKFK